jgi:SPP1 family predicted phage head-tail adaptor
MRSGDLRKRVTFQLRGTSTDTFGQQTTTWTDLLTTWADIQALSARELFAAQAVQSEVTHSITTRYRPEFALPKQVAAMRILYAGRIFNLAGAVNTDERNREIVIQATEGLDNG